MSLALVNPPTVDLARIPLQPDLLKRIPRDCARRIGAVAVSEHPQGIQVAMKDPRDIFAQDELRRLLGAPIQAAQAEPDAIDAVIDQVYRHSEEIQSIAVNLKDELDRREQSEAGTAGLLASDDVPVMRLLQNVFADAASMRASDIHLEPANNHFRIRHRVDGFLNEQRIEQISIYSALTIRLKLMAELDISEKRLPQEGRFVIQTASRELEVRLATMPTPHGEAITMRLLTPVSGDLPLSELGLSEAQLHRIQNVMSDPHGMVLVVGPTGSGKTTTLNAILQQLDVTERKLLTVEDPVECRLRRACQIQINQKVGLGYSQVLRSALRHDPDVVMVGEMRDSETADIAVRAALTGHLVLSTVHCNDAIACVPRLLDMGVEPYLAASALRLVLAQRLLRLNCRHCEEAVPLSPADERFLRHLGTPGEIRVRQGRGCNHCGGTGYRGRIGVYELLELDATMIEAIQHGRTEEADGQRVDRLTLHRAAMIHAAEGRTSLAEVRRVLGSL